MATPMRFRTDNSLRAEEHAHVLRDPTYKPYQCRRRVDPWRGGKKHNARRCGFHGRYWEDTPPAVPGDTWRVHWYKPEGNGPIAGYAICCPKCFEVHRWTQANNCSAPRRPFRYQNTETLEWVDSSVDFHSGIGSCWTWTGSAEKNQLSAQPSLFASGACGWHGFLTNGELVGA